MLLHASIQRRTEIPMHGAFNMMQDTQTHRHTHTGMSRYTSTCMQAGMRRQAGRQAGRDAESAVSRQGRHNTRRGQKAQERSGRGTSDARAECSCASCLRCRCKHACTSTHEHRHRHTKSLLRRHAWQMSTKSKTGEDTRERTGGDARNKCHHGDSETREQMLPSW